MMISLLLLLLLLLAKSPSLVAAAEAASEHDEDSVTRTLNGLPEIQTSEHLSSSADTEEETLYLCIRDAPLSWEFLNR